MTDRVARSRAEHTTLSLDLIEVARRLYVSVGDDAKRQTASDAFLHLYETKVRPHLEAEEDTVLSEAEEQLETRLLAQALRAQHRALDARVDELADATDGLSAVVAARAVHALFALHVMQVDDFLLPAVRTRNPRSRPARARQPVQHSHS